MGKPIISSKSGRGPGVGCMVMFCGVFGIGGLVGVWLMMVQPVLRAKAAQSWVQAECEITSSHLVKDQDSEGETFYRPQITYRYEVEGRAYESSRYSFLDVASDNDVGAKRRALERYPAGMRTTCWVDPANPASAVLDRELNNDIYWGLIPLTFAVIGFGIAAWVIARTLRVGQRGDQDSRSRVDERGTRTERRTTAKDHPDWLPHYDPSSGPHTLRPQSRRFLKLLGIAFAAVFWNGIVGVFIALNAKMHMDDVQPVMRWFMSIFLVPFVLIGLALIGAVIHQFLALFNPRAELTVSAGAVEPGQVLEVSWRLSGRAERIRRLRITLDGVESATYTRGTDTVTDRETFASLPIYETPNSLNMSRGRASLTIPLGTMHSFEAFRNSVLWSVRLHGEISNWPDLDEHFAIVILPAAPQRVEASHA